MCICHDVNQHWKNSVVSEEGHVLTAYGFNLVVSLASMQIKSFWNPFSKIELALKLKIYIDRSAWPAGSAVRIKKKRPKGKIVFKKKIDQTGKKNVTKKQKAASPGVEPAIYLHVQETPWPLHTVYTRFEILILSYQSNRRCLKLVELYLSWIQIYIWGKLA